MAFEVRAPKDLRLAYLDAEGKLIHTEHGGVRHFDQGSRVGISDGNFVIYTHLLVPQEAEGIVGIAVDLQQKETKELAVGQSVRGLYNIRVTGISSKVSE